MKTLGVSMVLVVLAVLALAGGLAGDQPGFLLVGTCALPLVFFALGYAVHRAGIGISISRGGEVAPRRSSGVRGI